MSLIMFKRFPVTDLFMEYRKDLRFIKAFYIPNEISSIDFIMYFPLDEREKKMFKKEELRIYNILLNNENNEQRNSLYLNNDQDQIKLSKMDFSKNIFCLSIDFFTFPKRENIFMERIEKYFDLIKNWTKSEFLNI